MEREVTADRSAGEAGHRDERQLGEQGAQADHRERQGYRGCKVRQPALCRSSASNTWIGALFQTLYLYLQDTYPCKRFC